MVDIVNLPDFFGAAQRGIQSGRETNEYNRKEATRKELDTLAPQIMAGDTAATTRGMVLDKDRADGYQDEHTRRLKQLRAAAKYMKQKLEGGDDLEIQAAWSSGVRPFLSEIIKDKPIPEAWTPDMRSAMEQALAMTAFIDEEGQSAAMKEFQAKARAAGLTPGTPEYENAAKIALGVNPRAVTGAVKFDTMTDAEGKPRPQRNRPDGSVEVFYAENNQWVPLGADGAPAAAPTESGPTNSALPQGGAGDVADEVAKKTQAFREQLTAAGVPNEQANAMAEQYIAALNNGITGAGGTVVESPGLSPPIAASAPAGNTLQTSQPIVGTLGVGRTKEAEEAAKKSATESMQTLTPDEVAAAGLPPSTFAQRNTLTGEIKVGPAAAQNAPGAMTAAQREKLRQQAAKAKTAVKGTGDELDRMKAAVQQLKKNKQGLERITGVMSLLPNIPGGAAANAQADLDALKSQIGFAVLQKMRQNSPTGGALGNVSDKEGARLEQNLASLDNAQSYEQMVERLDQIIQYVDQSKELLQTAYDDQFSEVGSDAAPSAAPATGGTIWVRDANGKLVRGN